MATHEFGHVLGGVVTGGTIRRVILHPLAISRTDVSPNPYPAIVVWMGPLTGCVLPLCLAWLCRHRAAVVSNSLRFFTGFCVIANGAYIAIGSFQHIGDCREMHATGTPLWVMLAFGTMTIPPGFFIWHKLGSLSEFFSKPQLISVSQTAGLCAVVLLAGTLAAVLS